MAYSTLIFWLIIFAFSATPIASHAGSEENVTGLWLTKKKDVAVRISDCGSEGLCGHIAWLSPEESAENPALCGTKVLWNMHPTADNPTEWTGGTLYKADENKYYRANLHLIDVNTVALRAYMGVPLLGKTKKFTRTTESTHPPCVIPDKN